MEDIEYDIHDNYIVFSLKNQIILSPSHVYLYDIGCIQKLPLNDIVKYQGNGKIAFGNNYNYILCIKIRPGKSYYFRYKNLIAFTECIIIEKKSSHDYLLNNSNINQYIWLSSNGKYEKIKLIENESINLNKSLLLIHDNYTYQYDKIVKIIGPTTFYIQSIIDSNNDICSNIFEQIQNTKNMRNKLKYI